MGETLQRIIHGKNFVNEKKRIEKENNRIISEEANREKFFIIRCVKYFGANGIEFRFYLLAKNPKEAYQIFMKNKSGYIIFKDGIREFPSKNIICSKYPTVKYKGFGEMPKIEKGKVYSPSEIIKLIGFVKPEHYIRHGDAWNHGSHTTNYKVW